MNNSRSLLLSLGVAVSLAGNALAQNDDCTGAISVVNGPNGPFTNVGSTTSVPAWPCAAGANDVWFVFSSPGGGTLTADTCGSGYDSCVQIFDGALGCGSLVSLGCNDDSCGLQSSLTVPVNAGLYYIRVGGFAGATGTFTLNVNGPIGAGTLATNTSLGAGCISAPDVPSYEYFATSPAFDLANTSISLIRSATGYLALPGFTTFVPPSATAQVLALTDDSQATVNLSQAMPVGAASTTTALTVCSNGYISAASGNGTGFTPTVATFLAGTQMWWSLCWHDFNPTIAGSGQVKFEQIGNVAYVTWDGVWDYAGTSAANANTMQAQFEVNTGNVHFLYGTTSTLGNGRLVGFSDAGTSADPGSMDISAVLPSTYNALTFTIVPLALAATTRPITGTAWNLNVTNVPPAGVLGIDILGLSDPGVNDLTFLGMPGCGLRASLDVLSTWFPTGVSHQYALAIPPNPALINFHIFTSSAVFVPNVNPFGAITASGIDGKIGDI